MNVEYVINPIWDYWEVIFNSVQNAGTEYSTSLRVNGGFMYFSLILLQTYEKIDLP